MLCHFFWLTFVVLFLGQRTLVEPVDESMGVTV